MTKIIRLTDSFSRPADILSYAAGDLVANSTVAASVVPLKFKVPTGNGRGYKIKQVSLAKTGTSVAAADFRIHLYGTAPTVTNGDNGAWLSTRSDHIGFVDLTTMLAFSDGASSINAVGDGAGPACTLSPLETTIYGLIEVDAAYAPVSGETFTAGLVLEQFRS